MVIAWLSGGSVQPLQTHNNFTTPPNLFELVKLSYDLCYLKSSVLPGDSIGTVDRYR